MYEIRHYLTIDKRDVYLEWLQQIRDNKAKIAIMRRVNRIEQGNFGDHKPCCEGVWELRVDVGPGYRVYYARTGTKVVLLFCGGVKRTQAVDIAKACDYWRDWQGRGKGEK